MVRSKLDRNFLNAAIDGTSLVGLCEAAQTESGGKRIGRE